MISLEPIGYVRNCCIESQSPEEIKRTVSRIELLPPYVEGLKNIEEQTALDLLFVLHREQRIEWVTRVRSGEQRGIFATRSPRRPNHIGVTTVKLLKREGNCLYVRGADALDGSPVVDIKCCDTSFFASAELHQSIQKSDPRVDIIRDILEGNSASLLLQAARLHGHICPGLALGVLSGMVVMQHILKQNRENREYQLMVEMQHCPVDGVLFVTGCTPGRNRFLFGDPQKNSFSLLDQQGKGWRVDFLPAVPEILRQQIPAHLSTIERGFKTLTLDPHQLFQWKSVNALSD